jgi:tripartite-type tricarboxylate transporter receptor subunit TctC
MNRLVQIGSAAAAMATLLVPEVAAQPSDYPSRPIRVVVPQPAGGSNDTIARLISDELSVRLKVPFVVENQTGAQGVIAAQSVARQSPDGYTLLVSIPGPLTTATVFVPKIPYEPFRDFEPIALLGVTPFGIVVRKESPYQTLRDLLAAARKERILFGSSGAGSFTHIMGEQLNLDLQTKFQHVPYRGAMPSIQDLLGGQIPMVITDAGNAVPLASAGSIRVLAITGKERNPSLPDTPTFAELGVPGFEIGGWFGMFSAKRTPIEIRRKLASEVAEVLKNPTIKERYQQLGWIGEGTTPEEFGKYWKSSNDSMLKTIKAANIKLE